MAVATFPAQKELNEFWDKLITKTPGKVTAIFPKSLYEHLLPRKPQDGKTKARNAAESYAAAVAECKAKVKRIVRECHQTNEKFTDPDFDIESDFWCKNCIEGLVPFSYADDSGPVGPYGLGEALNTVLASGILGPLPSASVDLRTLGTALNIPSSASGPESVHRIDWIFDGQHKFTVDGFDTNDVRQGGNGDCWWISAVATLCSVKGVMERVCVVQDEECGVYGFVFHRDGEWISTVVDDNLYLSNDDFEVTYGNYYDSTGDQEREWKKTKQTGSKALYYAKCADSNETWLPLLEKAYAKVHGDYSSIEGGWSGEAVEDMTGGVTTTITTNKILSRERLWKDLLNEEQHFIFGCSSPAINGSGDSDERKGLALNHAYSIRRAVEEQDENGNKVRLVLVRNPWGKRSWNGMGEWNGPWSDGSKEWTPYWLSKLNHRFGDDGEFWMTFDDLLKRFDVIDRTRLFNEEWSIIQEWTSVNVSWVSGYLNTKFIVEVKKGGQFVIVLSQLDERYFVGLEGQYSFELTFLLQEEGAQPGDHIIRARAPSNRGSNRAVSAEVDLEPGRYEVLPKILASRNDAKQTVEEVVKELADKNPQKLRQIGLNYDLAHAKVHFEEEPPKKPKEAKQDDKSADQSASKKCDIQQPLKAESESFEITIVEPSKEEAKSDDAKVLATAKEEPKADKASEEKKPGEVSVEKEEKAEEKREEQPQKQMEGKPEGKSEEEAKESPLAEQSESSKAISAPLESVPEEPLKSPSAPPPYDPLPGREPSGSPSVVGDGVSIAGDAAPQPAANPPDAEHDKTAWNAVCVISLRVFSKDPETTI
ncbi:cysteine proteinase, partial [Patellaria atrata CBS 101060]